MEFKVGDIVTANGLQGEYIFQGYLTEDKYMPIAYGKNAGKQERIASKGEAILKLKGSDKLPDYSPKSQLRKVE